jgi:WD40 repeat protein
MPLLAKPNKEEGSFQVVLVFWGVSVYPFLMENSPELGPEEFASLQDEGGATKLPPTRRTTRGSGQKRWSWLILGGALHLGALAILGFYLWQRYYPASEEEEKRPAQEKSAPKVTRRPKIDDGGSRLENRGARVGDRGSKIDKNVSQSSVLDLPTSTVPTESQDIVGEIRALEGHTDALASVAFFPDGRRGLSGSFDGTLRIWNLETGEEVRTLGTTKGKIYGVAISPDGRSALSGGEDLLIHLWDVDNSKEVFELRGHLGFLTAVAFSVDGQYAISGGGDRMLRLWDLEAQKLLPGICRHNGLVRSVAFDPVVGPSAGKEGGLRALSCSSEDGTMRLWNVKKGKELKRWKAPGAQVWSVAWGLAPSPPKPGTQGAGLGKSRALVGTSDGKVRLWDVEAWRELQVFSGHRSEVTSVAISPDGTRGLSGSQDRTIRLWDLETGEELSRFTREAIVASVVFSPDGRRALSGEFDNKLHVWGLPK